MCSRPLSVPWTRSQNQWFDAGRTTLALAPPIEARIDTHTFEAACAVGELSEALRLYTGEFLQGPSIEGCEAFEEWAFFRGEALRPQ